MIVIIVSNQYFTEEIINQERDKNGKPIQLLIYNEVNTPCIETSVSFEF